MSTYDTSGGDVNAKVENDGVDSGAVSMLGGVNGSGHL